MEWTPMETESEMAMFGHLAYPYSFIKTNDPAHGWALSVTDLRQTNAAVFIGRDGTRWQPPKGGLRWLPSECLIPTQEEVDRLAVQELARRGS